MEYKCEHFLEHKGQSARGRAPTLHADMRTCGPIIEMVRGQSYHSTWINNQATHLTVSQQCFDPRNRLRPVWCVVRGPECYPVNFAERVAVQFFFPTPPQTPVKSSCPEHIPILVNLGDGAEYRKDSGGYGDKKNNEKKIPQTLFRHEGKCARNCRKHMTRMGNFQVRRQSPTRLPAMIRR